MTQPDPLDGANADLAAPVSPRDRTALASLVDAVASRRDKRAFAKLFAALAPQLKAYVRHSGYSDAEAEAMACDTMVTVWQRATDLQSAQTPVTAWVFSLLRERLTTGRAAARSAACGTAVRGLLPERLARLPAEQALLLQKAFVERKSHDILAEELGLPLRTVRERLRQSLHDLRITQRTPAPIEQ